MKKLDETIVTQEDLLKMLDIFVGEKEMEWWNKFYANKEKKAPFITNLPDENLVKVVDKLGSKRGRSLDIGCGTGRNSLFLAKNGFETIGIDFSEQSIIKAKEGLNQTDEDIEYINMSFFDYEAEEASFDLIHDSGCLHHIKPHRRWQYLNKINKLLKDDGLFSLTILNEKGGVDISDYDVYRKSSMTGGLGYSNEKLKSVLAEHFEVIKIRPMDNSNKEEEFSYESLTVALAKKVK